MKAVLFCYVIAKYVSASTTSSCWSPTMPGPAGCSLCSSNELSGSQCVRSGRWFTCYPSSELCCKDGEVLNHVSSEQCLSEANKGGEAEDDSDSDSDSDDGNEDLGVEECSRVVTRTSAHTNRACMEECKTLIKEGKKPSQTDAWSGKCMPAHWHEENGRTEVDGECFEKWVYGYSEPNDLASYKVKLSADTPALCQALCQEDDDCVNWLWVSPLYAPGTEVAKRCMLKSQVMVDKALGMITETQPPTNLDVEYCNYQMGYACTHLYKCLPCEGDRRCVWESDMHVSGWKYCDHTDSCRSITPTYPESTGMATTVRTGFTSSLPEQDITSMSTTRTPVATSSTVTGSQGKTSSVHTTVTPQIPRTTTTPLSPHPSRSESTHSVHTTVTPQSPRTTTASPPSTDKATSLPMHVSVTPLATSAHTSKEVEHETASHPIVTSAEAHASTSPRVDGTSGSFDEGTKSALMSSLQTNAPSVSDMTGPQCPEGTQTGIVLEPSSEAPQVECPSGGCSGCHCCGSKECHCCHQAGIVLKISDKPQHLLFEISN